MGCGYVGRRVAKSWTSEPVIALTRGGESKQLLDREGIETLVANWLDSDSQWTLPDVSRVLVAVPHRPEAPLDEFTHSVGLANIVRRIPNLNRLVVLSTTGVYHQSDGQWVDEESPVAPSRIGPQIALAAEQWLNNHMAADRATVVRLAGIYGPGRIPLLAKLREKQPIPVARGMLNLIHVDDIARVLIRLLTAPAPSRLYVLSDGQPVERRTFYEDVAKFFSTPSPVFVEPEPGSSRAERSESDKRINPTRIFNELNLQLLYPNYIAGLSTCLSTSDFLIR